MAKPKDPTPTVDLNFDGLPDWLVGFINALKQNDTASAQDELDALRGGMWVPARDIGPEFGTRNQEQINRLPDEFYKPGYVPTGTMPPGAVPLGYDESFPRVASLDPKFQPLLDAALTGDRAKVDKAIAEGNYSIFDGFALPGQFKQLPDDTKRALATVLRDHPDVLPDWAMPTVKKSLEGVDPYPQKGAAVAPAATAATAQPTASAAAPQSTIDFIVKREGFNPKPFWDGDHYSIGYGTYATPDEIKNGTTISREEGLQRLTQEVAKSAAYVDSLNGKLTDNQRTALISMAYNVGTFGKGLTTAIQSGDPDAIAEMMGKYRTAKDPAASAGVSNRRDAEIALFKTPGGAATQVAGAGFGPQVTAKPASPTAVTPAVPSAPTAGAATSAVPPKPALRPADLTEAARNVFDDNGRYRKGASGDDVREIQHFLNMRGATDDRGRPLKEDGVIGNLTRQAIKDYQEQHPELVKDGVIGPRTMAVMLQDQKAMQEAAAAKDYGNMEGPSVPKLLSPLALADPISEQMNDAAKAGAAVDALARLNGADPFSGPARVAANLGANLGGYIGSPKDYINSLPDSNPEGVFGKPAVVQMGGFSFHPNESFDYSGHARTTFNELALPHDTPIDPFRTGGFQALLGPEANAQNGEIVYNATAAAARRLQLEGVSPEERAAIMGQGPDEPVLDPVRLFIPPPDDATTAGDPTAVNDPFPLRSPMTPDDPTSVNDPFPQRSEFPPGDPTSVNDPFPQRSDFPPDQPTLSTDDANTLFVPEPVVPDGSGSLSDNLTDELGGAAG